MAKSSSFSLKQQWEMGKMEIFIGWISNFQLNLKVVVYCSRPLPLVWRAGVVLNVLTPKKSHTGRSFEKPVGLNLKHYQH